MTQPGDGIDLSRSMWQNPEGFAKTPRPYTPPVPSVEVCGDVGPEGWTCDLKPDHTPREEHWAETGESGGLRWKRAVHDAATLFDPPGQSGVLQGRITEVTRTRLDEARAIATSALESDRPAHWAIALERIRGLDND